MEDDLSRLRTEYDATPLQAAGIGDDPMACFREWFDAARAQATVAEPNAMSLATVAADGTPSVRMVLLKAVDPATGAFTWFSNLESRKGSDIASTGHAALCWWWPGSPGRQVRAVGRVEYLDDMASDSYFASRPPAARIGALASDQSRAVASRAELDARADVAGADTQRPASWGGMRLIADELEFWQGRPGRMHDRITFLRLDTPDGDPVSARGVEAAGGLELVRTLGTVVVDPHGRAWLRLRLQP